MKTKNLSRPLTLKQIEKDGEFSGHASVFGNVDSDGEIIAQGAFADSLAEHASNGTMPKLLWQHRPSEPIGIFKTMEEDEKGLFVEGQLALKTQLGAEAHELLKMGAISGMSIGFRPVKWETDGDTFERTFTEIELVEASLVTFPANEAAQVDAVKAQIEDGNIPEPKDFEAFLRDAGLSRKKAKALMAEGYKGLTSQRDVAGGELLSAINRLTNTMR